MSKISGEQASPLASFKTGVHTPESGWGRIRRRFTLWLASFQSASGPTVPVTVRPWVEDAGAPEIVWVKYLWMTLGLMVVAGLGYFSLHLAGARIYQVDECCNVWVARLLALGKSWDNVTLFQILLSWLVKGASTARDLYSAARFFMFELFWVNVILIAVATGERLFSRRGLAALVGAATLAPFWDYGLEVRHDNLLLTGLLLIWCAIRHSSAGRLQSYFLIGALAVALQFTAFKAFVYTVPISAAVLIFPPGGFRQFPRWKVWSVWFAGAAVTFVILWFVYHAMGLWGGYSSGTKWVSSVSEGGHRFWPGSTLFRLLNQTPLLLALWMAGVFALWMEFRRKGWATLNWEGNLPEVMLCTIAFGALMINPTPFPYNLLNLVPFVFLVAFRQLSSIFEKCRGRHDLLPVIAAVVVFTHFIPFAVVTSRHLKWTNSRQEVVMTNAERLTDPAKDAVFDGVGMVPTRAIEDGRAFLHSLNIKSFKDGSGSTVRDFLAAQPAPVLIPNYRTDWLPEEDHEFIRERYVSLADDFWVLGKVVTSGEGSFEIIHPGRYRISNLEGSDLAGTYDEGLKGFLAPEKDGKISGTLDGVALSNAPVQLAVGTHHIKTDGGGPVAIVWVGPQANRIHRMSPRDHRRLFYNWY
jgi:hypothetical protein